MAITTYAELQTAVQAWLDRTDLTSRIPEFISLAEAKLNRELRVRPMEVVGTDTMSSGAISLPTDWVKYKSIWYTHNGSRVELQNMSPQEFNRFDTGSTDYPSGYYIAASSVYFGPSTPNSDYTVGYIYYQKIPALTDSATTNWLLTSHPDIYLYGALLEAAPYIQNQADTQLWATAFISVIEQLKQGDRDVMSGAPMSMRAY